MCSVLSRSQYHVVHIWTSPLLGMDTPKELSPGICWLQSIQVDKALYSFSPSPCQHRYLLIFAHTQEISSHYTFSWPQQKLTLPKNSVPLSHSVFAAITKKATDWVIYKQKCIVHSSGGLFYKGWSHLWGWRFHDLSPPKGPTSILPYRGIRFEHLNLWGMQNAQTIATSDTLSRISHSSISHSLELRWEWKEEASGSHHCF
jgi:hypothetical protein